MYFLNQSYLYDSYCELYTTFYHLVCWIVEVVSKIIKKKSTNKNNEKSLKNKLTKNCDIRVCDFSKFVMDAIVCPIGIRVLSSNCVLKQKLCIWNFIYRNISSFFCQMFFNQVYVHSVLLSI